MLNFNSLLIFSEKPKSLADFYQKVFDKKPDWEDGEYIGFSVGNGMITVGPHDKVHGKNMNPERIMFNLESKNVKEEFKRLKEMDIPIIQELYHPMDDSDVLIATFKDPDGNYFQIASPMEMD